MTGGAPANETRSSLDLFSAGPDPEMLLGRPFHLGYDRALVLVDDEQKARVGGIPCGAFLLGFCEREPGAREAILLRAVGTAELPYQSELISAMIEQAREGLSAVASRGRRDGLTRYELGFSGLECRVLGTFYAGDDADGALRFGADLESFSAAHCYRVFKAGGEVLERIVNFRDHRRSRFEVRVGRVRYSSTTRLQDRAAEVPVRVAVDDLLGKRTAVIGMAGTGKSATLRKIVQATAAVSRRAAGDAAHALALKPPDRGALEPFDASGLPRHRVGQIIFDVSGEHAGPGRLEAGPPLSDLFPDDVIRYAVVEKAGFKSLKINFYSDVESGFALCQSRLARETADYARSIAGVDLAEPEPSDFSARTRWERKRAAYLCCLYQAGFKAAEGFTVSFAGNKEINAAVTDDGIDPRPGVSLDQATAWFLWVWDNYEAHPYFEAYKKRHGHEWADEDLKALLVLLSRKRLPGGAANVSGHVKLRDLIPYHTTTLERPFEMEIMAALRHGRIVIVDLSQEDPTVQALFSERICRRVFQSAMERFVRLVPNNFIQFYFEEAHDRFPRQAGGDPDAIYERIAKEGAKLNLGLVYSTPEPSSISPTLLKGTANWFVAHLGTEDELREVRKLPEFADVADALGRFNAGSDRGFVRVKTSSRPFVVPVQLDPIGSGA